MYQIVKRKMIAPNVHELVVEAPNVAASVEPGQFIIVRPDETGERIPLSVADWDSDKGTVTTMFIEVGVSTGKLARKKAGDSVPTYVGPLGMPTEIEDFGTVLCVGGCYGLGSIFPIARALRKKGNKVYTLIEARSSYLLYFEQKLKSVSEQLFVITRDGTQGQRGHFTGLPELLAKAEFKPDRIIANGCTGLMRMVSETTRPLEIKTIVSMNPIMIDGTGMCGVCRLTVGGKTKFACVDGPDFDAHEIDWEEFYARRRMYVPEESTPLRKSAFREGKQGTEHACRRSE